MKINKIIPFIKNDNTYKHLNFKFPWSLIFNYEYCDKIIKLIKSKSGLA